jgi:hypothetical protein
MIHLQVLTIVRYWTKTTALEQHHFFHVRYAYDDPPAKSRPLRDGWQEDVPNSAGKQSSMVLKQNAHETGILQAGHCSQTD